MKITPLMVAVSACVLACVATAEQKSTTRSKADTEEESPTPRAKKGATPRPKPKAASEEDGDASPKAAPAGGFKPKSTPGQKKVLEDDQPLPKSTSSQKKSGAGKEESSGTSPSTKAPKATVDEKSDSVKKKEAEATPATPLPGATPGGKGAPAASIESKELARFQEQPPKVQGLIEAALVLSRQGLTYKYGSDDPANGGMDCSGSVAYLLREQGFKDVPRDAAGQYVWARKHGQFFAVISKKSGGFEFDDLQPGDLMFWSGTYAIDRDPPVTHSMIYLGEHKSRKQRVMWGASDGRPYDGQSRFGVGVFDFRMPKAGGEGEGTTAVGNHPDFLGYARIPGLREAAESSAAKSQGAEEKKHEPQAKESGDEKGDNADGKKSAEKKKSPGSSEESTNEERKPRAKSTVPTPRSRKKE